MLANWMRKWAETHLNVSFCLRTHVLFLVKLNFILSCWWCLSDLKHFQFTWALLLFASVYYLISKYLPVLFILFIFASTFTCLLSRSKVCQRIRKIKLTWKETVKYHKNCQSWVCLKESSRARPIRTICLQRKLHDRKNF